MTSLELAGNRRALAAGTCLYSQGEPAETLFIVIEGQIELRTLRRGASAPSALRSARAGERFGEECMFDGARRSASALAVSPSVVTELPVSVYRRLAAQSGALERDEQRLEDAVIRDALLASAFGSTLRQGDLEEIAGQVELVRLGRGERLYAAGERAGYGFVLAHGLMQLEAAEGGIFAYLSPGDLFGDEEALDERTRPFDATALGDSRCLKLPVAVLRRLDERYPGLLARVRRVLAVRQARQSAALSQASSRTTQHVFKDLYRLQIARSLLVIDLDSCVRCGHCAYACAQVHGVSRLVRRGEKIVARLDAALGATPELPKNLLLPNSCQHCENAACMIECPTGAIGRDAHGEVFIRESLCTGCGACAKACPWDNIQMAPRSPGSTSPFGGDVAVKCDLCREQPGPACLAACPTEAIARVDPARSFEEVRSLFGRRAAAAPRAEARPNELPFWIAPAIATALVLVVELSRRALSFEPSRGAGLVFGVVAAVAVLSAAAHAVPKRAVRFWLALGAGNRPESGRKARPGMRRLLAVHFVMGGVALAATLGHAGFGSLRGAHLPLTLSFWTALVSGALALALYRFAPKRLSLLERAGLLPEDFGDERARLLEAFENGVSRRSAPVKALFSSLLSPYARSPFGFVRLMARGRGLRDEERALRARIEKVLSGRGRAELDGLDGLIRTAVELSALRGRRLLTILLRGLSTVHAISSLLFALLVAAHVAAVVVGRFWLRGSP